MSTTYMVPGTVSAAMFFKDVPMVHVCASGLWLLTAAHVPMGHTHHILSKGARGDSDSLSTFSRDAWSGEICIESRQGYIQEQNEMAACNCHVRVY